jgi:Adenylate and Guanylate cyclase catalytic domain
LSKVLRGEKARFQLFGDTVNLASRMERTGIAGKIQISQKTAELIRDSGREEWLILRPDQIEAKGIGFVTTYWLHPFAELSCSCLEDVSERFTNRMAEPNKLRNRFIDWNVAILKDQLLRIQADRANSSIACDCLRISKVSKLLVKRLVSSSK